MRSAPDIDKRRLAWIPIPDGNRYDALLGVLGVALLMVTLFLTLWLGNGA